MTDLEVRGLQKSYGSQAVLRGLDLRVEAGSFTSILGASGSGKTTLLRVIAGFERAEAGEVRLEIAAHAVIGSGNDQAGVGNFAGHDGERIRQEIETFLVMEPAKKEDQLGAGEFRALGAECAFFRKGIEHFNENAVGDNFGGRRQVQAFGQPALLEVAIVKERGMVEHSPVSEGKRDLLFQTLPAERPRIERTVERDDIGRTEFFGQSGHRKRQRVPYSVQLNDVKPPEKRLQSSACAAGEKTLEFGQWGKIFQMYVSHMRDRLHGIGDSGVGVGKPVGDDLHLATERRLGRGEPRGDHRRATGNGIQGRDNV